jgi:D-sedoheptulose 7-phosphate isomerase
MVKDVFKEVLRNLESVCSGDYPGQVEQAIALLVKAFQSGNKLLVFGNGGSAADAQHICAELVGRFSKERRGLPAIDLASNSAALTSLANDYRFAAVFSRQVEAFALPGDVAWGISTSGTSDNVIEGLQAAKSRAALTIGLCGQNRDHMAPCCDVLIAVPLSSTPRVQEIHGITYHIICAAIEEKLFG